MTPRVRHLGTVDYEVVWQAMRAFTEVREERTADELWFAEHPPVYTLGLAARLEHVLAPGSIPVVQTDRGGQVTYHGPGQLLTYVLFDLKRAGFGIRQLVTTLEQAVIDVLASYGIAAERRARAPGVYVDGAKIAALGLRVRRGRSYHGIALNIDLDLAPFQGIDPCGYPGLRVTRLCDLGIVATPRAVADRLEQYLRGGLNDREDVSRLRRV